MMYFRVLITVILTIQIIGFQTALIAQTDLNEKLIILIDPGHGGKDSGTVGLNGIQEKAIVLNIAKAIVDINKIHLNNKFEIYLTRYKDTLISLENRASLAKLLKADIFLSLHCNHSDNPNARGVEAYVFKRKGKHSKESILLAYTLQNGLKKEIGIMSRGVKFANFQVLRETVNECSSLLLEIAFLSNRDESHFISNQKNLISYAYAILKSLTKEEIK